MLSDYVTISFQNLTFRAPFPASLGGQVYMRSCLLKYQLLKLKGLSPKQHDVFPHHLEPAPAVALDNLSS